MLILLGDHEDSLEIEHHHGWAIQKFELGRGYKNLMDATYLNRFSEDSKLIFVGTHHAQAIMRRLRVHFIDAPILTEVYDGMLEFAADEYYLVGNIFEMSMNANNKTGYRAELFFLDRCRLNCIRKLYIDNILDDLSHAH